MFGGTPTTTAAAAATFVVLAMVLALVPVPYVTWSPGRTADVLGPAASGQGEAISISGLATHPTRGQLRLTTVAVTRADSRITLPAALAAEWLPWREVLPRAAVYAPGTTDQQSTTEGTRMMDTAQQSAVAAGLRSAGVTVTEVTQVVGVTNGSPADGRLEPGDTITRIDGAPVTAPADLTARIRAHHVGDTVRLGVRRAGTEQEVTVPTVAASGAPTRPMIGASVGVGYEHPGTVTFGIDPGIGGPSAGLVFALAIHDRLTTGDLTGGRVIAATGTIDADGRVGSIGGLPSKVAGARSAGAALFLIPAGNCDETVGLHTDMPLVPVDTLQQAIDILSRPDTPTADLPHCS
ncbi:YlbL family protein [Raineyella fluvialis]|uniref:PDZ domain-containing protein n=1 Tax=Raineyella fluvialis TaxID=2662261 RepID=A0A5Q2FIE1_9ACTN|nr:PDZ domain-containing protein [Raineyella fluvialis]QGF24425.1 PDZ domain-containing protein [Raineyella fluvialis]